MKVLFDTNILISKIGRNTDLDNKCEIVISENWSDFERISDVGGKYGVLVCKPENFEEVSESII